MNVDETQQLLPRLSKSRYLSFVTCPRLGYLGAHPSRFAAFRTEDEVRQALFAAGTRVGELARDYYPGGLLIAADHLHIPQALRRTQRALASGEPVIYEPALQYGDILVRVDILRRLADGSFELTEVKSGTKVDQARHIPDVAIQLHVAEASGLTVSRAALMHLNGNYVHREGRHYRLADLFVSEDVTDAARYHVAAVLPEALADIRRRLRADQPPAVNLRNSCKKCEYYQLYCRPRGSTFPVGELGRATQAIALLEAEGISDLRDLSPDSIAYARLVGLLRTSVQGSRIMRMLEAIREGELRIEPGAAAALRGLTYPLHFLDFETWSAALPVFVGTSPYQQIPFQWSDHRLLEDGALDHAEYLADGPDDPRLGLALALTRRLADGGTVFAYHAAFERQRLHDLACISPRLEESLLDIASRLVDLEPIVTDNVYHPAFHGSYSLKAVLPALVPDSGYEGLAIQNGSAAALAYEQLRLLPPGPERDELRADMLAYCAQDTNGLVDLYRALRD